MSLIKGHRSLGSLFNVKNQKVAHSVSESVSQLKTKKRLLTGASQPRQSA